MKVQNMMMKDLKLGMVALLPDFMNPGLIEAVTIYKLRLIGDDVVINEDFSDELVSSRTNMISVMVES